MVNEPLRPGKLRRRVTILAPVRVPNAMNEEETSYLPAGAIWAEVIPLASSEIERARQAQLRTTHRIRCWFTKKIAADCRLCFGSSPQTTRTLEIVGIIDVGDLHKELEISAADVTAG